MTTTDRVPIRTRRPRAEREQQIIAAAKEVFSERGYGSASVAEIAQRVGIVEGAIYKYFPSKGDLLIRVMQEFYDGLIADVRVGVTHIRSSEDRLRYIIAKHVETFIADVGLCRLLLREVRPDSDLYASAIIDLNRRYTSIALSVIVDGMRSGEFRPDLAPTLIRDMIYGSIEHAVWRIVFGDAHLDADLISRQLADAMIYGIAGYPQIEHPSLERLERIASRLEAAAEK